MNYAIKSKILSPSTSLTLGVITLASVLSFFPMEVSAETVVRTGDSISIAVGQIVENNLYAAAGSVSLSGIIVV